ncbi:hypothetical protein LENIMA164B_21440 [Lelliottia nimipressuralis]
MQSIITLKTTFMVRLSMIFCLKSLLEVYLYLW